MTRPSLASSSFVLTALPRRSLLSTFGLLASIMVLGGCPTKPSCSKCYVGGVMTSSGGTVADPKSALYLQLKDAGGKAVTAVEVTLSSSSGETEILNYEASQLAGVNETSVTSIPDPALYDIDGESPSAAKAKITLKGGQSFTTDLGINTGSGDGKVQVGGDKPKLEQVPKPAQAPELNPSIDPAIDPKREPK